MSGAPLTIAQRGERIRARIERACERANRDPATVTVIAVTKTHDASVVVEALHAGFTHFGENRVQEGLAKMEAARQLDPLAMRKAEFHLIGHLQTNKARAAANAFSMIHSVDSAKLLESLAASPNGPVRCLVEVNISGEESKFGISPAELPSLLATAQTLPNIELVGLMTVAPLVPKSEETRPIFRQLAELGRDHGLSALSMGMTNDYEIAIEEGATHVRIGRAIFGERA